MGGGGEGGFFGPWLGWCMSQGDGDCAFLRDICLRLFIQALISFQIVFFFSFVYLFFFFILYFIYLVMYLFGD